MNTARSQDIPYDLLAEYLLETASPDVQARVAQWLAADPAHQAVLLSLEKMLRPIPGEQVTLTDTESAWNKLAATIQTEQTENKIVPMVSGKRQSFRWQWAAILIVTLGGGLWMGLHRHPGAISGPRLTQLKDGSEVQLDSSASLVFTSADATNNHGRKMHFEGKGAFNVVKRTNNEPFIVRMGKMEIHALSSHFYVDYEPKVSGLRVHVQDGQVMVIDHDNNDSVTLKEGMLIAYNTQTDKYRVGEHVTNMDHRQLVFKDIPLSSVLSTVETMYDVQVAVSDSSRLNTPITATFTDESIDDVMESVSNMTNTQLQKVDGQSYRIK